MKKFNLKNNSYGLSLIQVMVSMGLVSVLGLAVAQIGTNATKAKVGAEAGLDIQDFRREISRYLTNPSSCAQSFSGVNNLSNSLNLSMISKFPDPVNQSLTVGQETRGKVILDKAMISNLETTPTQLNDGDKGLATFNVKVTFKKIGKGFGSSEIIKTFPITANVVKNGSELKLDSCYSDSEGIIAGLEKKICDNNSGIYDEVEGCLFNPMPKNCSLKLYQQDGSPSRSRQTGLSLTRSRFTGLRLRGNVNSDDTFYVDGSCQDRGHKLSEAFSYCSIGIGQKDTSHSEEPNSRGHRSPPLRRGNYNRAENTIGSTANGPNRLRMQGDVNSDDRFYYRLSCNRIPERLEKYKKYLNSNCNICFGHSNAYRMTPDSYTCNRIGNSWGKLNAAGGGRNSVDSDDIFFLGFYCGEFPGLNIASIQWD